MEASKEGRAIILSDYILFLLGKPESVFVWCKVLFTGFWGFYFFGLWGDRVLSIERLSTHWRNSDRQKGGWVKMSEGYWDGSAGHLGETLYGWVYTPIHAPLTAWLAPHLKLVWTQIQNQKGANSEEAPGRPWVGLQGGTKAGLIGP